jgi:hypothetical protein
MSPEPEIPDHTLQNTELNELRGFGPQANYTDRATAAYPGSYKLLRI